MDTDKHYQRPIPKWVHRFHMACEHEYGTIYRDEKLKAQMEVITPRIDGVPGIGKITYFLDGDEREFESEKDMIDAIIDGPRELWTYAGTTRKPTARD